MLILALQSALAQAPPPIVNGEETEDFLQVGALMVKYGSFWTSFCSGTLVHAEWVVTAAHCVEAIRPSMEVEFWLGSDLTSSPGVYGTAPVIEAIAYPEYDDRMLTGDIGLVHLDGGFPEVQPILLNEEPVSGSWRGEDLTFVGFGITSDNAWDSDVKRTADLPVYDYDDNIIYVYDPTGQNLCSGDSGGAGLLPADDGTYRLAGVNSFVYPVEDWSTYCEGGGAGATRVDRYVSWIADYVPLDEAENWTDPGEEGTAETGDPGTGTGTDPAEDPDAPARPFESETAGGCSTVAGLGGGWLLGLLGLALRRRRP